MSINPTTIRGGHKVPGLCLHFVLTFGQNVIYKIIMWKDRTVIFSCQRQTIFANIMYFMWCLIVEYNRFIICIVFPVLYSSIMNLNLQKNLDLRNRKTKKKYFTNLHKFAFPEDYIK